LSTGAAKSPRSYAEAMPGNFNKVFCLGLSRTGTTSLHEAFRMLGLRAVHFPIHLFTQPEVLGLPPFQPAVRLGPYAAWRRGKELKASPVHHDARALLEGSDAFCDLPVPLFYRELDRMFPGSKFVLTTRDPDSWLESMRWLFKEGAVLWKRGHVGDELHQRAYGTTVFDQAKLLAAWERHHQEVENFFHHREGDLLRMRVDHGDLRYETLAGFLGMETPLAGPCPRVNEARAVSGSDRLDRILKRFPPFSLFALLLAGLKKRGAGR
jgi:hypothetical protein